MKLIKGWNTGFKVTVHILVQNDITDGWYVILKFSKPIAKIECWIADVQTYSPDKRIYVLVNKPHQRSLKAGTQLEGVLILQKGIPNSSAPTASVTLRRRQGQGGNGTPAPTTSIPATSPQITPAPGRFDLDEVLHKSILFYEVQRSGKLPSSNRIPWRGNSAMQDRGLAGEDLTGGWYDAGDHVKFGFPMAYSTTVLAWGLNDYRDAYEASGELPNMLESIKWPLDYFLKAHSKKYELYGQVGSVRFCSLAPRLRFFPLRSRLS